MSDMIRATLSADGTLSGNVSPEASVAGNLTQGPIIVNDFVIDLQEVPEGVLLTVRKGSDVKTALIPMGEGTGTPGADGGYYSVGVSQTSANTLQFRFTPSKDDMTAVAPVTVTLPAGPKGEQGEPGKAGSPGEPGTPGDDGISPTVSVSKSGKVTTISITDKNGTKTATVNDGADGQPGKDGSNGTSVTVKSVSTSSTDGGSNVVTFSDGKTITIKNGSKGSTGATGATGPQGPQGADGAAGKTAYQYAQDGGYTGTENEFSTKLAEQAVSTAPQTLTDTQKAQARTNIGAVNSWNDIPDRPFGETYSDTLTLEQITDPSFFDDLSLVGGVLMKVSSTPLTMDDLSNGFTIRANGEEMQIPPEGVGEMVVPVADGAWTIAEMLFSVDDPAVGVDIDGLVFDEIGVYVNAYMLFEMSLSVTVPGWNKFETVKKLNEKYIPSGYKNLPPVQSDWNETDETSAAFIKNKPTNEMKHLYGKATNGVEPYYITEVFGGEAITRERFQEIISEYTQYRITINGSPVQSFTGYNGHIAAVYIETSLNGDKVVAVTRVAHTAEYTPT